MAGSFIFARAYSEIKETIVYIRERERQRQRERDVYNGGSKEDYYFVELCFIGSKLNNYSRVLTAAQQLFGLLESFIRTACIFHASFIRSESSESKIV